MKILVTGSSGTIGTRLCETLLQLGHSVQGVDWVKNKWQPSVDAITTQCDMRKWDDVNALQVETPDVLVHFAANARVYDLVQDPFRALDNFTTLFHALEFARQRGVKYFVFSSSREGYGNMRREKYTEDLVRIEHCESPYTASKVGGEALVHAYRRCYGLKAVIFRFSNVYGMYDDSDRVIPLFIRRCMKNEPLTVFGDGKCLDFTYIDDNVNGVIQAINTLESIEGETFNLGNGAGTTITELAETVKQLLGSDSSIEMKPARTGEVTHYIADITHAKEKLGYDPKVPFADGIRKTVEWYKAHSM